MAAVAVVAVTPVMGFVGVAAIVLLVAAAAATVVTAVVARIGGRDPESHHRGRRENCRLQHLSYLSLAPGAPSQVLGLEERSRGEGLNRV